MKNATKMSSSASRDSTSCIPSKHSSSPPTRPEQRRPGHPPDQAAHHQHHQRADDGRRRPASRTGPSRTIFSPSAISHLPTSGCTIIEGSSAHMPVVWPLRIFSLASVDVGADVAEVRQRPGVLGVVGLVEEERRGARPVPQPQEQGQAAYRQRRDPAENRRRSTRQCPLARPAVPGVRGRRATARPSARLVGPPARRPEPPGSRAVARCYGATAPRRADVIERVRLR